MNDNEIHCEVCNSDLNESKWESHIKTDQHKENVLTQIMKDRIGRDKLSDTRDETTEFLEELHHDFLRKENKN